MVILSHQCLAQAEYKHLHHAKQLTSSLAPKTHSCQHPHSAFGAYRRLGIIHLELRKRRFRHRTYRRTIHDAE